MTATLITGFAPQFLRDSVGSASGSISVPGHTEIGTGTATAFVLSAAPYVGALVSVYQGGTATGGRTVVTDATGVTIDAKGNRTITLDAQGDSVLMVGISTTRWQILASTGLTFS